MDESKLNELELDEYEARLLKLKCKFYISMALSAIAFILGWLIVFHYGELSGYIEWSNPWSIMLIMYFFIFLFGFVAPFLGLQFTFERLEEIHLARQLLRCDDFQKIIEIFNSCWSRWDNLKIKQEALEKGILLANQPQEIALIYKLAPADSEIEKRVLVKLIKTTSSE